MSLIDVEEYNRSMLKAIALIQDDELDILFEAMASGKTSFDVPSPYDFSKKYYDYMSSDEFAIQRFMAGIALSVAQSVIATSKQFGEREVKAYLKMRREFHPLFIAAAGTFASYIEGTRHKQVAPAIRKLASLPLNRQNETFRLLPRIAKSLIGFKMSDVEDDYTRKAIRPLFSLARVMDEPSEESVGYSVRIEMVIHVLNNVIKFTAVPPKLKTFFRKVIKTLKQTGEKPTSYGEVAEIGAWLDASPEEKAELQAQAIDIRSREEDVFKIEDIEKRRAEYKILANERMALQRRAGINIDVIERGERITVDEVLKREKKMNRDSVTGYIVDKWIKEQVSSREQYPEQQLAGKREQNKVFTQLGKAKTIGAVRLIIQRAIEKRLFSKYVLESLDAMAKKSEGNLAVKEGIPLAPLDWEPLSESEFRERHDVGRVRFGSSYTEVEKKEIMGRVSRALADIETVYGTKVAGRHAKKLAITFEDGAGVGMGAAASYFGYDDPRTWQPRVKFGKDFDNLLAHELSHYFDDLIANEIDKRRDRGQKSYGDVPHGPGDIFGTTGVTLEYSASNFDDPKDGSWQADIAREVPELAEWIKAVNESPDHERWKDLVPGAYDYVIDSAIKDVMGDMDWKDSDKIRNISRKSKLPAGIADRADELYSDIMSGDKRRLSYPHSVVEVWARMCEQYVYTKLSRDGVANPWLTRISYDTEIPGNEVFMEQDHFDRVMVPIYDRLFERLRKKGMIGEGVGVFSLAWLLQEALA